MLDDEAKLKRYHTRVCTSSSYKGMHVFNFNGHQRNYMYLITIYTTGNARLNYWDNCHRLPLLPNTRIKDAPYQAYWVVTCRTEKNVNFISIATYINNERKWCKNSKTVNVRMQIIENVSKSCKINKVISLRVHLTLVNSNSIISMYKYYLKRK